MFKPFKFQTVLLIKDQPNQGDCMNPQAKPNPNKIVYKCSNRIELLKLLNCVLCRSVQLKLIFVDCYSFPKTLITIHSGMIVST